MCAHCVCVMCTCVFACMWRVEVANLSAEVESLILGLTDLAGPVSCLLWQSPPLPPDHWELKLGHHPCPAAYVGAGDLDSGPQAVNKHSEPFPQPMVDNFDCQLDGI